jgi:hypothetical protein
MASPILKDDSSVHPSWRDENMLREEMREFRLRRFED